MKHALLQFDPSNQTGLSGPDAMTDRERILDHLATAVLAFDDHLNLTSINPAGEMLFALSANQTLGQPVTHWLSHETDLHNALRTVLDTHRALTAREVALHLPGRHTITVDYTITPITDGASNSSVVMEMVRVDRILRLAQEEKMQHQHSTNRAVLRGVAHEIKNPLGGIRGAAQLLERALPDKELTEYTQVIIQEADRLRLLIDRMFGPNQPLQRSKTNIHEVLQHIRRLVSAESQSELRIVGDYDPSLPDLQADRDQLIQAILNIVRNAAQAMDNKGTIVLRTRIERQFTISGKRYRLVLRVDVEDDGPGIPEELIGEIFYPMVTGRPEGTGLGLSIAQDIVARHDGLIECHSQPGKTVFSIFLPLGVEHEH